MKIMEHEKGGVDEPVPDEMWQRLYATATKVRELEPWLWMEETDIFGVQDPESGKVIFVSVMGLLGEYYAVAVYPDSKALAQFWQAQRAQANEERAELLMETWQLHCVFGKKSELDSVEKRVVKQLGMNFKGANTWPHFRSFLPGYFPWGVQAREARLLVLALEHLLDVAPRVKENRRLLARKQGTCRYLVREFVRREGGGEWRDEARECPPPAVSFRICMPQSLVESVRALKPVDATVEMDVFRSMFPVGERGERMQAPYLMLGVDAAQGFVLGVEMLTVEGEVEGMWAQVPERFLRMLEKTGWRPKQLALRPSWVVMVMEGICRDLGIAVTLDRPLRELAAARRSLERMGR